jgi:hypothetical protein
VSVRLDRAVATPSWSDWFPVSSVRHIVSSRSDHTPILLELEKDNLKNKVTRIPRYEIMWEREDTLSLEINQAWRATGKTVHDLGDVADSLQKVMGALSCWSKEKFGAVTKELAKIRENLEALSLQDPVVNQAKIADLTKRMDELLYCEEMKWLQRSRVAWLKEGDRNTQYFHRKATGRAKMN